MSDSNMKRSFWDYPVVVFDLDGTLYYQKQLRVVMAKRLVCYYLAHPFRIKELFIVKRFRQVRENWNRITSSLPDMSLDEAQYSYVAEAMHTTKKNVEAVILRWIYENPLDAVAAAKDETIARVIETLKKKERKTAVFSDYPTEDKLNALGISVDLSVGATDERLNELKPSPKGLVLIMNDLNVAAEDILMVGDRFEKDGLSAKAAGCDYLILSKSKKKRKSQYELIGVTE